ncbi:MAG: GNAT family N-acetyltransferase, partial [Clostridia bacterium]|nr:GNAT family N-acetyltransferase [Clostridia bacterium]
VWERAFPEDAGTAFLDWFFTERYLPDWCVVAEREGRIAGVAHTLPLHLRVRDTILPCAILGGVATETAFRGQGVMREIMTMLMRMLHARGVPVLPHRPVELRVYASLGHYPASDFQYAALGAGAPRPAFDPCLETDATAEGAALYTCYGAFSKRYSGVIDRSYADFACKLRDYASSGAACVRVEEAGIVTGYCVYYEDANEVYGDECVARSPDAYRRLCEGMALRAAGKQLRMRLAPDVVIPGAQSVTAPRSVIGVADVRPLLRAVGLSGGSIEVTDDVVPENAGIMDLEGNATSRPPQLRIGAGRLAQWAMGYRSMADIAQAGQAEVLHDGVLSLLDA